MDAVDLVTREQLRAECGNEIPEGRRQAIKGVQLCTECQSLSEK